MLVARRRVLPEARDVVDCDPSERLADVLSERIPVARPRLFGRIHAQFGLLAGLAVNISLSFLFLPFFHFVPLVINLFSPSVHSYFSLFPKLFFPCWIILLLIYTIYIPCHIYIYIFVSENYISFI